MGQAKLGALATSILNRRAGIPVTQMERWSPIVSNIRVERALHETSVSPEQKLLHESQVRASKVDALKEKPRQPILMLKQTPLVMRLVGANFRELYALPHFFERAFEHKDGSKSTFGIDELKQIPQLLTDPVAIFDQGNGRKLFVLDLQTKSGAIILVPVEFEAQKDFASVNFAVTAFAKEKKGKPKYGWIKKLEGQELYVNTKK